MATPDLLWSLQFQEPGMEGEEFLRGIVIGMTKLFLNAYSNENDYVAGSHSVKWC